MNRRIMLLGLAIAVTVPLVSCNNDLVFPLLGNWVRVSDFDGRARTKASAFVIDNVGYITGGYDGEDYYNDTWSYDATLNAWTQKADFPGVKRSSAVGFATNSYGYVGTGYDGTNKLSDFYKYDPSSNSWTQIADFPGTARYEALAFGIGTKGYVGTGYDGNELKDFYKYDESTQSWSTITSIGGSKRKGGAVFVINNIAYVGFGINNGSYTDDFWAFDPSSETWTQKADTYSNDYNAEKAYPAAFAMGGIGFVSTGSYSGVTSTTWAYNPSSDEWEQKSNFEGTSRQGAVAFTLNDYGYVLTGNSGSSYFDDIWKFYPDAEQDDND